MKVWLLAGYAGSGKTTAGNILHRYLPSSKTMAFADLVKDKVSQMLKFDRHLCDTQEGKHTIVEGKTVREHLIAYSALHKLETNNPAIWVHYIWEEMKNYPDIEHWIVHDWRYEAEYQFFVDEIGSHRIQTIRILHPSVAPLSDSSEHQLDTMPTDAVVVNNGSLQDFEQALIQFTNEDRRS